MNIFYTSLHNQHQPPNEIFNGNRDLHQEVPERVDQILRALKKTNHVVHDVQPNETEQQLLVETLGQLHATEYVQYLQNTDFSEEYVYPSVFPYRSETYASKHPVAQRGLYSFDTYTPISNTTFGTALGSAYLAQRAAAEVLSSNQVQYALCRPPGHHAESSRMGGYCYFNNGGVAAQTFRNAHSDNRVAILDVDFHHGNGAEQIFGETEEVLTLSIHADPNEKFPFFSGQETNEYVSNRNFPLPLGTTNAQYKKTLQVALDEIKRHKTSHLVICFGADTHESDPIGGFLLTTDFYTKMAQQIAALKIPTVVVQEGGYNTAALGQNVVAFLEGFEE
jgi:acetoin utilization deacetylase AcuC-like enzyme